MAFHAVNRMDIANGGDGTGEMISALDLLFIRIANYIEFGRADDAQTLGLIWNAMYDYETHWQLATVCDDFEDQDGDEVSNSDELTSIQKAKLSHAQQPGENSQSFDGADEADDGFDDDIFCSPPDICTCREHIALRQEPMTIEVRDEINDARDPSEQLD